MVDQKSRFFKPSIAQLEERGTVTDAFYPEVAGSSPARRTLFSLPETFDDCYCSHLLSKEYNEETAAIQRVE